MQEGHDANGAGLAVLDIGGPIGAAVVYFDPAMAGHEVEIRPFGGSWDGTHTAVRERRMSAGSIWAALFQSLRHGCYELRLRGPSAAADTRSLDVEGGVVTEIRW